MINNKKSVNSGLLNYLLFGLLMTSIFVSFSFKTTKVVMASNINLSLQDTIPTAKKITKDQKNEKRRRNRVRTKIG